MFAAVQELYLFMERPLINVKVLETLGLHEHYGSYVIEETDSHQYILSLFDLFDYSVLNKHHSFDQANKSYFVCMKWNVEDS